MTGGATRTVTDMTPRFPDAFVILTGGTGRRLGGLDKATLALSGMSPLDRAIEIADGRRVVIVGPHAPVGSMVQSTREVPPGGGPAAAVAAGVDVLAAHGSLEAPVSGDRGSVFGSMAGGDLIAVWAVDQIGVTTSTWRRLALAAASPREGGPAGAVLLAGGRRQYGVGVFAWRTLARACAARTSWQGAALRALLDPLVIAEVAGSVTESRDVDTLEDLQWWHHHYDRLGVGSRATGSKRRGD